jgi:hypothetical protein
VHLALKFIVGAPYVYMNLLQSVVAKQIERSHAFASFRRVGLGHNSWLLVELSGLGRVLSSGAACPLVGLGMSRFDHSCLLLPSGVKRSIPGLRPVYYFFLSLFSAGAYGGRSWRAGRL